MHPSKAGRLVAERAADRYGIELGDVSYADGRMLGGKPVEIKGCQRGKNNHFRIWRDNHVILARQQGYYVFAYYSNMGPSIRIHEMVRKRAIDVSEMIDGQWIEAGHEHTDSLQYALAPGDVFR